MDYYDNVALRDASRAAGFMALGVIPRKDVLEKLIQDLRDQDFGEGRVPELLSVLKSSALGVLPRVSACQLAQQVGHRHQMLHREMMREEHEQDDPREEAPRG